MGFHDLGLYELLVLSLVIVPPDMFAGGAGVLAAPASAQVGTLHPVDEADEQAEFFAGRICARDSPPHAP